MVEVFKTNVSDDEIARHLIHELHILVPNALINFDLDNCDKILRVERQEISISPIIDLLKEKGHICEVLED